MVSKDIIDRTYELNRAILDLINNLRYECNTSEKYQSLLEAYNLVNSDSLKLMIKSQLTKDPISSYYEIEGCLSDISDATQKIEITHRDIDFSYFKENVDSILVMIKLIKMEETENGSL